LIANTGFLHALQFRLLTNVALDDNTILTFQSIQKGSDIAGFNWILQTNVVRGPITANAKMKTAAFLASILATAAAFAPAKNSRSSVATNMAFENELGAQAPLGFFDPLGLVEDGDQEKFDRLRYVEIKHGRICMLGVVGYLVTYAGYRLPGDIDLSGRTFADIGYGFKALQDLPAAGAAQIVLFIGFLELAVMKDVTGTNEFVGDFRNGFLDFGWDSFDEKTKLRKRAIELNQGRAAQMGLLGLMVHEQLGVPVLPEV
jgi:hypothetical protein